MKKIIFVISVCEFENASIKCIISMDLYSVLICVGCDDSKNMWWRSCSPSWAQRVPSMPIVSWSSRGNSTANRLRMCFEITYVWYCTHFTLPLHLCGLYLYAQLPLLPSSVFQSHKIGEISVTYLHVSPRYFLPRHPPPATAPLPPWGGGGGVGWRGITREFHSHFLQKILES